MVRSIMRNRMVPWKAAASSALGYTATGTRDTGHGAIPSHVRCILRRQILIAALSADAAPNIQERSRLFLEVEIGRQAQELVDLGRVRSGWLEERDPVIEHPTFADKEERWIQDGRLSRERVP